MNKLRFYIIVLIDIFWALKEEILFWRIIQKTELKPYQLMYVNPKKIKMTKRKADPNSVEKINKKFILDGNWDMELVNPLNHQVVKASYDVSRGNNTWELVGEYSRMEKLIKKFGKFDNYHSMKDLKIRYKKLDNLINIAKIKGFFESQKFLKKIYFREYGGLEVAIGRYGDIIKIGDGQHRLGIALGLGFKCIPVCVIRVHTNFLNRLTIKK